MKFISNVLIKIGRKVNLDDILTNSVNILSDMVKSKFFEVFNTFSKEDRTKFGLFVNSDYFNSSDMLRRLYAAIMKHEDGLSAGKVLREDLFKELYPDKEYREGTIVNLLSGLYKLAEEYISQQTYEAESFQKEAFLLKGLGRRKLDKFSNKIFSETASKMNNAVIRDVDYFHKCHEIEYEYISFLSENDKGHDLDTKSIQNYHDKLIKYFTVKFLAVYTFMLNQKAYVHENEFDIPFLEYLLKYLNENPSLPDPTVSIYFNMLMLIKDGNEQYYFKLKELMKANPDIFSQNERRNLYVNMVNYTIFKSRVYATSNKLAREPFELFKYMEQNKLYLTEDNSVLDHLFYLIAVMTGLNAREFDWVENFINKHKNELVDEHRNDAYNLCYALFCFSKKNYEKSLEYLSKVRRKHTFFNLQVNTLSLQNYYELNLFENAFSLIDSYRHYLKENPEVTTFNVNRTKDFLDVVNKLLKIKCGKDKYVAKGFDLSNEAFKKILKREWVIEKIAEVQKS